MSNERIIHTADLREIERNLQSLGEEINFVQHSVHVVNNEVQKTQGELQKLIQDFNQFVKQDMLMKNIQLAETRLVKIRQELEKKFGHYDVVRRKATGILQAVDAQIVKKETIESLSEEDMIHAPGYWLAPCLVALAAWINNDKQLADKAIKEAIHRDDEKTSLFFALVSRRGNKLNASRKWLERYFTLLDPHALKRETVILINGFASGVFGLDSRLKIEKVLVEWMEELEQNPHFTDEQRQNWKESFYWMKAALNQEKYPFLQEYSETWPQLKDSLEEAMTHKKLLEHFTHILEKESPSPVSTAFAVDAVLESLVSEFDEEELPLKRKERQLSLIIEHDGDEESAAKKLDLEKTLEEKVDFARLMTNMAMDPKNSRSNLDSQKLAVSMSKDILKSAHSDYTVETRNKVPTEIDIVLDQWKGKTVDGKNERELLADLQQHMQLRKEEDLKSLKPGFRQWTALISGIFCMLFGIALPFFLVFGALLIGLFFFNKYKLNQKKQEVEQYYTDLTNSYCDHLRASLAEVVEYREELALEDQEAETFTHFVSELRMGAYLGESLDGARKVMIHS